MIALLRSAALFLTAPCLFVLAHYNTLKASLPCFRIVFSKRLFTGRSVVRGMGDGYLPEL